MIKKNIILLVAGVMLSSSSSVFSMEVPCAMQGERPPCAEAEDLRESMLITAPFADIAQIVHKKYYLKPYKEGQTPKVRQCNIPRLFHGGMHVMRVAIIIEHLCVLYKKYGYDKRSAEAAELLNSKRNIRLLMIAALMHDSGREGEEEDLWEAESYQNCLDFLKDNGIDDATAEKYASIIKKAPRSKRSFAQHLLCTADAIDIIRTRGFNGKYCENKVGECPCSECEQEEYHSMDCSEHCPECGSGNHQLCKKEKQYGYFNALYLAPHKTHFNTDSDQDKRARAEYLQFIYAYRKMLGKQGEVWFPAPVTPDETALLKVLLKKYSVTRLSRAEYIKSPTYFRHIVEQGDLAVDKADRAKLYEMDRSFSFQTKASYELADDCYKKLKADFVDFVAQQ